VRGWQRAGALVRFFLPENSQNQRPGIDKPQYLFASGPVSKKERQAGASGSKSFRPEQTLTPLSDFLGADVPIDLSFAEGEETAIAAAAAACSGVVLIAWQHEEIPAIANAILQNADIVPEKWPGERFDAVWVFDLRADEAYAFSQVPQMVLAGDLSSVIT
jgi:hypothetical protein